MPSVPNLPLRLVVLLPVLALLRILEQASRAFGGRLDGVEDGSLRTVVVVEELDLPTFGDVGWEEGGVVAGVEGVVEETHAGCGCEAAVELTREGRS